MLACMRACVRACVLVCVRACASVHAFMRAVKHFFIDTKKAATVTMCQCVKEIMEANEQVD